MLSFKLSQITLARRNNSTSALARHSIRGRSLADEQRGEAHKQVLPVENMLSDRQDFIAAGKSVERTEVTCTSFSQFVTRPASFRHLKLIRCDELTKAGYLEDLVTAFEDRDCKITSLDLSCNNFGAAGGALASMIRPQKLLRKLTLSWTNLCGYRNARNVAALAPALSELRSLESLDITFNELGPKSMVTLAPSLQCLTGLRELSLYCNELGDRGVSELSRVLPYMRDLRVLDLGLNDIGGDGVKSLACALTSLQRLECLRLVSSDLTSSTSVEALVSALRNLPHLSVLNLGSCAIGHNGLRALIPVMEALPELMDLDLSYNQLGESASKWIPAVISSLPKLKTLNLSHNNLGNSTTLQNLVLALKAAPHLHSLGLQCCGLNHYDMNAVALALDSLDGLETLDISCNYEIADWRPLGSVLAGRSKLTELRMSHIGINDDNSSHLFPAVAALPSLQKLYLSGNAIGAVGSEILSSALAAVSGLYELDVSHNPLGEVGIVNLSSSIQYQSKLKSLDLGYSGMADIGAKHLAKVVPGFPGLKQLRLGGNDMSTVGALHLIPSLMACPQLEEVLCTDTGDTAGKLLETALRIHRRHCTCLPPN